MIKRPGQIALVVVLVVVVGLTVAVSVLSRSVTTVNISTKEQEKARSFSAAEAGIEDALRQNLSSIVGGHSFAVDSAQVNYQVSQISNFTAAVDPGDTVTIDWSAGSATQADISWVACAGANLISTVITTAGLAVHGIDSSSPASFTKTADDQLVRLRFTCPASVTIAGNDKLSFYEVDSSGVFSESASRVRTIRSQPAAIGLMDFAIFSGGSIQ